MLHRPLNVDTKLAEDITRTCCIFQNYVRRRDGCRLEDILIITGSQDILPDNASRGNQTAILTRENFAHCFISREGELAWQYSIT
jgi:hypothetical protein